MKPNELDALIEDCLEGRLSEPDAARLSVLLEQSAEARTRYWETASIHGLLEHTMQGASLRVVTGQTLPAPPRINRWFAWRPLTAMAAGLAIGLFSASMVFAYTQPRSPVVVTKVLPLVDADFESGSQIPAQGTPARASAWSGDFSRVVNAENGITPKHGQHMLRFLRSDHELSPKNERSYVGSAAQVIDLRPLRADLSGAEQLVEVSAQFNSVAMRPAGKYEFAVKAGAYHGDIADAPKLWDNHGASVSRSDRCVIADSDVTTWQRVAVPLVVPPDADFLVIECAVVLKAPQATEGVAEFPGHYVDQVEVRLNSSVRAWTVAHHAN